MYNMFEEGNACWNTSKEREFIAENYPKSDNISIDYGIMEKAENVFVMSTDFGWNDLGTWGSLYDKLPKDEQNNAIVNAKSVFRDAANNMVSTPPDKKIIVKGLSNYIIVDTEDTIMIFPKADEQNIKQVSKMAEERFKES